MAVVTYDLGWEANCVGWSSVPTPTQRIAVTSFITDGPNQVVVLEKNAATEQLEAVGYARINYPPTKVAFAPPGALTGMEAGRDMMVTASDFLRLWNINEIPVPVENNDTVGSHPDTKHNESESTNKEADKDGKEKDNNNAAEGGGGDSNNNTNNAGSKAPELPARFKPPPFSLTKRLNLDLKHSFKPSRNGASSNSGSSSGGNNNNANPATASRTYNPVTHPHLSDDFNEPVTSFDWNFDKPSMVAATSTDTTICVWDIVQQQLLVQLIAHDRPVYDCSFAPGDSIFASCGADGSVRVFDLRAMDNCTIVYEEGPANPMLRVAWSRHSHYIAATIAESERVVIVDMRNPTTPVCLHAKHAAPVNAIAWAPQYGNTLCCVGEDKRAMIWDINAEPLSPPTPQMTYEAEAPINGVSWNKSHEDWVSIAFGNKVSLLLV